MANIYDVAGAIQQPNIPAAFQQGVQTARANTMGNIAVQQAQQQKADTQTLRGLAPQIIAGDPNAYAQAAALNPDQANSYQSAGDAQLAKIRGAINYLDQQKTPEAKQAAYANAVKPFLAPLAAANGHTIPDDYQSATPGIDAMRARIASLGPGKLGVATPGSKVYDQFGNVVVDNPTGDKPIVAPVGPNGEKGLVSFNPHGGGQASLVTLNNAPSTPSGGMASPDFFNAVNGIANEFGGTLTSGVRDAQHNAEVGGVPNSQHLTGTAADMVVSPDQKAAAIAKGKALGLQPIDEGDHIHFQNPNGGAGISGVRLAVGTPAPKTNSWDQRLAAADKLGATQEQKIGMVLGASGMNNAASSDLTPDALENATWQYIQHGTLPPVGRGGQGQAQRTAIMNHAADVAKASDISPAELATNAGQQKALQGSLNAYQKRSDAMAGQENSFLNNLSYAQKISDTIDRTASPAINKWLLTGEEQAGDPDVVKLKAALTPVASDYAKIMSGATGAGGTPVSTMQEAMDMIRTDLSKGQFNSVADVLRNDVHNQRVGSLQQLNAIRENMSRFGNGTQGGSKPKQTPQEAMGGAAPGASTQGGIPDDIQALLNKYPGAK